MSFDEKLLEFGAVRDLLKERCVCDLGRRGADVMSPITDEPCLNSAVELVREMMSLLDARENIPIYDLCDCSSIIKRARFGGVVFEPMELLDLRRFLEVAGRMRMFFEFERAAVAPGLHGLAMPLYNLPQLMRSIDEKISPDGLVRDTASGMLAQLRSDINRLTEGIKRDLLNMVRRYSGSGELQDQFWTMRNNRYVLPVKSTHRGRIQGIIHDSSNSGETVFVEPFSILEQTNALADFQVREREEVYRILRIVSAEVTAETAVLQSNEQVLAEFDLIHAKARFALSYQCVFPHLTGPERPLRLNRAHHPLLYAAAPEHSIPLDLQLRSEDRALIVTGPNAGGKTTALKTVGLSVLMVLCGVPIPAAEGSHMPVFSDVLAAIGDEQNVLEGESTFSSHMRRLRDILAKSGDRSLVLLDELGTATDPSEGGALAVAILESLCEKQTLSIVSTHLSILKNWAEQYPAARNASFRLDPESHRPTFRLQLGLPGISEAIVVAEAVGIPGEIIERARALRPKGEEDAGALIAGLQKREREMCLLKDEAHLALARAEAREAEVLRLLEETREERRKVRAQLLEEKQREIEALRTRVETLLANQPGKQELDEERRRLRREAEETASEKGVVGSAQTDDAVHPEDLKPGDMVYVETLREEARVVKVRPERGEVRVQAGALTVQVKVGDLRRSAPRFEPVSEAKLQQPRSSRLPSGTAARALKKHIQDAPMTVEVIGMRLAQAEDEVDAFLARALSGGLKTVRVVHGHGTGALRRGLHDYFRTHPLVKSYCSGGATDGGTAVTLVELK